MQYSFLSLMLAVALPGAMGRPSGAQSARGAVYLISNAQANSVVSLAIGADGTLSKGSSTSTGGAGSNAVDAANLPETPDALASQSSLTVAGKFVFAVNAGSNTLSMLKINNNDPTKLTLVGKPAAIPAEFPTTVGASVKNKLVCVGASGATAGVSCASFSNKGLGQMDTLRPFELNQTTPPVGPLNTVSQVFFSDDQSKVFTTVKGDPTQNNTGFLATFPVQQGGCGGVTVARAGTQSSPKGTAVLFGSSTIPGSSDLFVTDASFGGAVLAVDDANTATIKGQAAIDGQKATCWVAISPATCTAFVTDVGTNRLVEMSVADASIQNVIDLSVNGDPGLIDLKAAGNFIYALSPGNGTTPSAVTVLDAISKKQVQHFQVTDGSVDKNAMGMAVFTAAG